jgi:hypothetical protein
MLVMKACRVSSLSRQLPASFFLVVLHQEVAGLLAFEADAGVVEELPDQPLRTRVVRADRVHRFSSGSGARPSLFSSR